MQMYSTTITFQNNAHPGKFSYSLCFRGKGIWKNDSFLPVFRGALTFTCVGKHPPTGIKILITKFSMNRDSLFVINQYDKMLVIYEFPLKLNLI
jgi:hypothetical protein